MEINIRQETPADYDAVYRLVKEAFATADHSDGDEQDLVVRLRKSEAFIPELSLVAEADGVLAGYILLTKIGVGEETELAAAPPRRRAGLPAERGRQRPYPGGGTGCPGAGIPVYRHPRQPRLLRPLRLPPGGGIRHPSAFPGGAGIFYGPAASAGGGKAGRHRPVCAGIWNRIRFIHV